MFLPETKFVVQAHRRTAHAVVTGIVAKITSYMITTIRFTKQPFFYSSGGPLFLKQSGPKGDYLMQVGIVSFGTVTCERLVYNILWQ